MNDTAPLNLKLENPLVVFDLETTGVVAGSDHIIELAAIKVMPDGTEIRKCWLLNPCCRIPPETSAIHGITDAMVKDCPTFKERSREIYDFFEGCDLGGFNSDRFDIPCLEAEFERAGFNLAAAQRNHIDVQRIYHKMEPRDLTAAVRFYCNRDHAGAHGAEADAQATLDVLKAQLAKYAALPKDSAALDGYLAPRDPLNADRAGLVRWNKNKRGWMINFGQKKGAMLRDLFAHEQSYLRWICKGTFDADVRAICRDLLEHGKLPPPPKGMAAQ
ncbi:MAG: 3'-5' exonuclease [Kiritimatiellae bacterium]|nr:3'-5' exonuclease [Kiritimatiellia bacterium]